jgi:hypothetical protein
MFTIFFLFLWVIIAFLDPDPDSESGYTGTDLTDSGSNPVPQHCVSDPDMKFFWIKNRSELVYLELSLSPDAKLF